MQQQSLPSITVQQKSTSERAKQPKWIVKGLRVRLIGGSRVPSRNHRAKGRVIEAHTEDSIRVEIDRDAVLTVHERDCETVIPDRGQIVRIVYADRDSSLLGQTGHVVDKDSDRQRVRIKLKNGREVTVHYDDCCETID